MYIRVNGCAWKDCATCYDFYACVFTCMRHKGVSVSTNLAHTINVSDVETPFECGLACINLYIRICPCSSCSHPDVDM